MTNHRVLICGDREWDNQDRIDRVLCALCGVKIVIEGEARGADTQGRIAAEKLGIDVLRFPAKWKEHGRAAGPIRNTQMLKEGEPDTVLAFHNDILNSKGTLNMVNQAKKRGIPVIIVYTDTCQLAW